MVQKSPWWSIRTSIESEMMLSRATEEGSSVGPSLSWLSSGDLHGRSKILDLLTSNKKTRDYGETCDTSTWKNHLIYHYHHVSPCISPFSNMCIYIIYTQMVLDVPQPQILASWSDQTWVIIVLQCFTTNPTNPKKRPKSVGHFHGSQTVPCDSFCRSAPLWIQRCFAHLCKHHLCQGHTSRWCLAIWNQTL